jgi:hypothetical protein
LKARHTGIQSEDASVSPLKEREDGYEVMANEAESDEDEEGLEDEMRGEKCERITVEREDKVIKKMQDPKLPTQEEVEKHKVAGHLPFRSWCPTCVMAKGREMDHKQDDGKERKTPEYSWDYCFPGDEFGFKWTVLVGRNRGSKSVMATTVPTKGGSGKFGVDKCLEFIEENGDRDGEIVVKTDQEPSILYLVKDLMEGRGDAKTMPEESPVKSSGSNGIVERTVQDVEGQIRALWIGFQERMKRKVDTRERIVAFIPEYATYLLNRMVVGADGKVAYERIKGKKPTLLGLEFGEKVLYKKRLGNRMEKINARWDYGIFLGVRRRSNEVWLATQDGIISIRTVRRIPMERRWSEDCVKWVKWAPWHRYKDAPDADGDLPEGVPAEERRSEAPAGERVIVVDTRAKAPREFYISKEDVEKHGATRGCGGCSSIWRGLGRQPHTEACRERLRGLMKDGAKVKNTEARKKEFEEKVLEKKRIKDDKREEKKKRKAEDASAGDDRVPAGNSEVYADGSAAASSSSGGVKGEKRNLETDGTMDEDAVEIDRVEVLVEEWVKEIQDVGVEEDEEDEATGAWDDVHGGDLPLKDVVAARKEEVGYMEGRKIWSLRPIQDCWKDTERAPVSVRWVDTNKGGPDKMEVRSRLVARDFKGKDKGRDDLFAETPPLEAKRMLFSRAATRRQDGRMRKLMFVDAKKAHLNPKCEKDVYIELPEEAECPEGMCGKLNFWLYGFRPAAAAWENHYADKFEEAGFERGVSCGVVFYHKEKDLSVVVHGDDFTFCGVEEDLLWIKELMEEWFEIKVRAILGQDEGDQKEVVILGRIVRWKDWGIEYEADPKHKKIVEEYFGFESGSRALTHNGDKDEKEEEWEAEELDKDEAKVYRGLAARINFMSLDCPDLQFASKPVSRDMAKPTRGSWKKMKKLARYLLNYDRIVWEFRWQDSPKFSHLATDSDWGGSKKERHSTSGGMWMLGNHCIKTWSATQGPYALSSAEAEFYGMVEGVTRAKGLLSLSREVGFQDMSNVIHLGTDSSAAKSFVCRRGLGRMRHLEIRDLWLQKEVREGKVEVSKLRGDENPADLMTKFLKLKEVVDRLGWMNIKMYL